MSKIHRANCSLFIYLNASVLGLFYLVMNKFKGFFTFIAFVWLCGCGFWAIFRGFVTGEIAWLGVLINAWALPVWMLLRYRRPAKFSGDLRETPAFAAVLLGLAVVLLADFGRGQPVYLAVYNLFILLVYLFHLSALRHPQMPPLDALFPELNTVGGGSWSAAEVARREKVAGLLLVFLRGSFCADSRALLAQLSGLSAELQRRNVKLILCSAEAESTWRKFSSWPEAAELVQLVPSAEANSAFVASGGVPLLIRLLKSPVAALRPSLWLLDDDGYVVWRHLPENYRLPGNAQLLRGQLFRLEE